MVRDTEHLGRFSISCGDVVVSKSKMLFDIGLVIKSTN